MTTEEGNKIIAAFMGATVTHHPQFNEWSFCDGGDEISFDSVRYHLSWDWLMPVVGKIESTVNSDDYEVDIFGNCCDIGGKFEGVGKSKIEATYNAVIKFIEWYNQQKKTDNQ